MILSSAGQAINATQCLELGIVRCLTKPVKQSDLLDAILKAFSTRSARNASRRKPVAKFGGTARQLHILLAEDGLVNQQVALGLLEMRGHSVVIANNGKEAVAALEQQPFDVVLMDIQMPEMDGLEATAAIRLKEKGTGVRIPILAMTAHAMKGDRERCLAADMDGYISKPIQSGTLYASVEGIAAKKDGAGTKGENDSVVALASASSSALFLPGGGGGYRSDRGAGSGARRTESLKKLVQFFLEESAILVPDIHEAIARADLPRMRRGAHTLKGSADIFAAKFAVAAALRLELMAHENNLTGAEEAWLALKHEIERVRLVLANWATEDSVRLSAYPVNSPTSAVHQEPQT